MAYSKKQSRSSSVVSFATSLPPPAPLPSPPQHRLAAKPEACDSGSKVFMFQVAHPQQLDYFFIFIFSIVVVVCTPHSLARSQTGRPYRLSFLPAQAFFLARLFLVEWSFTAQRVLCVSAHLCIPQVLTPTPTAELGRGPRLSTCTPPLPNSPAQAKQV